MKHDKYQTPSKGASANPTNSKGNIMMGGNLPTGPIHASNMLFRRSSGRGRKTSAAGGLLRTTGGELPRYQTQFGKLSSNSKSAFTVFSTNCYDEAVAKSRLADIRPRNILSHPPPAHHCVGIKFPTGVCGVSHLWGKLVVGVGDDVG